MLSSGGEKREHGSETVGVAQVRAQGMKAKWAREIWEVKWAITRDWMCEGCDLDGREPKTVL